MEPEIWNTALQRLSNVSLPRRNVATIFPNRTPRLETGLAGWAYRTRTAESARELSNWICCDRVPLIADRHTPSEESQVSVSWFTRGLECACDPECPALRVKTGEMADGGAERRRSVPEMRHETEFSFMRTMLRNWQSG